MRFGAAGSPYRTSLHLPPSVEPRWVTLIYAVPPPSNFLGTVTGSAAYKLVHFIATSTEEISLLRNTLEGFREGRLARGLSEAGTPSVDACVPPVEEKIVRENEVRQLCQRLGMGLSAGEISAAFKACRRSDTSIRAATLTRALTCQTTAHPNDFLDFKAFQAFVKLLKRRTDVEAIFARWLRPDAAGLTFDDWTAFVREDQRVSLLCICCRYGADSW